MNLSDSFRRWRNVNAIEKYKGQTQGKSKIDVAQRIIRVWKENKINYFNKWRQYNQIKGLQDRITGQQKESIIKLL